MSKVNISLAAGRAALKLRKHSPTILFATGIAGTVATVVVACKATIKAQKVHEKHTNAIGIANDRLEKGVYDKDAHKHHVVTAWTETSINYAKLYGPAFILGVTSIACLTKSHQILTSRNTAVMAAYAGLDKAFKGYRQRVVEELGEEKDTEFAHGVEKKVATGYDEKGNGFSKDTKSAPKDAQTAYGKWFDERNRHWAKEHGYNTVFLENQQKWANLRLKSKGHLFLNDVYEMLGFEDTAEGQQVGWYYDNDNGDGYVDFGFNRYPDFMAGYERTVFLDFNVDGPILQFI